MGLEAVFNLFSKERPAAMMAQLINQEMISQDLDVIFHENRDRQYQRELLFSYLTLAVADVVMGVEKSPNKAYTAHQKELRVSKTAFYDKLNNVEPAIDHRRSPFLHRVVSAWDSSASRSIHHSSAWTSEG